MMQLSGSMEWQYLAVDGLLACSTICKYDPRILHMESTTEIDYSCIPTKGGFGVRDNSVFLRETELSPGFVNSADLATLC